MDTAIVEQLTRLSDEERAILRGQEVRRDAYSLSDKFIVNSAKLLEGQELALRPHTRFVDFPEHGHDYMECMYVYAGKILHAIGRETVLLERGDLLFLNRHARHSIRRAEAGDIGINFILSRAFLRPILPQVRSDPVMSGFLTNDFDDAGEAEYLYFRTKDCFPIRNLMDNLIYAIVNRSQELYAGLVTLLFHYLAYYRDTLVNVLRVTSPEAALRRAVLSYLERRYADGTLRELAGSLGYNEAYLSRKIKAVFRKSFQQLLQEQRLAAAEQLLRTTRLGIDEIVRAVGYENQSYFYRLFERTHGMTPRRFRRSE